MSQNIEQNLQAYYEQTELHKKHERNFVAGLMYSSKEEILEYAEKARPEYFNSGVVRVIFEAIQKLREDKKTTDVQSVIQQLFADGKLKHAGGPENVVAVADSGLVNSRKLMETYFRYVLEGYALRKITNYYKAQVDFIHKGIADPIDLILTREDMMDDLKSELTEEQATSVSNVAERFLERIQMKADDPSFGIGAPMPVVDLFKKTRGWKSPDLIVWAARPAMGKTDSALHFGYYAACAGENVAILSYEMTDMQMMERLLAMETQREKQDYSNLKLHEIAHEDGTPKDHVLDGVMAIKRSGIKIAAPEDSHWRKVLLEIRRLAREGTKIIFIDYLSLINVNDSKLGNNRNQQIGEFCRRLKRLCIELDICIVLLQQLSREVGKRADKRPILTDLRDSGEIEQHADTVIFLHRQSYYESEETRMMMPPEDLLEAELIIAKQRGGITGRSRCYFIGKYGLFVDQLPEEFVDKNPLETFKLSVPEKEIEPYDNGNGLPNVNSFTEPRKEEDEDEEGLPSAF